MICCVSRIGHDILRVALLGLLLLACGGGGSGDEGADTPDAAALDVLAEAAGDLGDGGATEPLPEILDAHLDVASDGAELIDLPGEDLSPEIGPDTLEVTPSCAAQPEPDAWCADRCQPGPCQSCGCDLDAGACVPLTLAGEACCLDDADCDDDDPYSDDTCPEAGGACAHAPSLAACPGGQDLILLRAAFEPGGPVGVIEVVDDNDPSDLVAWHMDSVDPYEGSTSLYFGDIQCRTVYSGALDVDCLPLDPTGSDAGAVRGRVQTAEISLPEDCGAALRFQARFEGEAPSEPGQLGAPDQLVVSVVVGEAETIVLRSAEVSPDNSTHGEWRAFGADLSTWAGQVVRVAFTYDTLDGYDNLHAGLWLDRIVVRTLPQVRRCSAQQVCDDGDTCSTGTCVWFANAPDFRGVCDFDDPCPACAAEEDCPAAVACEALSCDGRCRYTLDPGCCQDYMAHDEQTWRFDQGWDGWTAEGADAEGADEEVDDEGIGWHWDAEGGDPSPGSLYFGRLLERSYAAEGPVSGAVLAPPVLIPEGPAHRSLHFRLWLSTEWDALAASPPQELDGRDRLEVLVAYDGVRFTVWRSDVIGGSTASETGDGVAFEDVSVDLTPWRGKMIRVGFRFDSGDAEDNDHGGVVIDEVRLSVSCAPACDWASDCDDGLACTADTCAQGVCGHQAVATCCDADEDCDDASPCTSDACDAGVCVHVLGEDPSCCFVGTVPGSGEGFESGSLEGFTLTAPEGATVRWGLRDDRSLSGAYSLWFGNPQTGTYEDIPDVGPPVAATGRVDLPPIQLPVAGTPVLTFGLYLDTDWNATSPNAWTLPGSLLAFDHLSVLANEELVWSSLRYDAAGTTCWGGCAWETFEASLAPFAGQSVVLSFVFDSLDAVDNAHDGPFVDDLAVRSVCAPYDCFSSLECDDPNDPHDACTRDRCVDHQCDFQRTYLSGCCYPVDKETVTFEDGELTLTTSSSSELVTWQTRSRNDGGQAHAGLYALYFGDAVTATYDHPGEPVAGHAIWVVEVPESAGYLLEWWQWLDLAMPDADTPEKDELRVSITPLEGDVEPVIVFSNKPLYGYYQTWRRIRLSLDPWIGQEIAVRFEFASYDALDNEGQGIYLDDLSRYLGCD